MNRVMIAALLFFIIPASGASADAPRVGVYSSAAGDLLAGRFSESWVGGGRGLVGNTMHLESWDGTALGGQWGVSCAAVKSPPVLIEDRVDETGTGYRTYRTVYSGGSFWLTGAGPWGTGDPLYGGEVGHYAHTTTYQYESSALVSCLVNVQLEGYFEGYGRCIQLTVTDAAGSGVGVQSRGYPVFLEGGAGCTENKWVPGEWGDIHDLRVIVLNCNTPLAAESWGTIKSLYR